MQYQMGFMFIASVGLFIFTNMVFFAIDQYYGLRPIIVKFSRMHIPCIRESYLKSQIIPDKSKAAQKVYKASSKNKKGTRKSEKWSKVTLNQVEMVSLDPWE